MLVEFQNLLGKNSVVYKGLYSVNAYLIMLTRYFIFIYLFILWLGTLKLKFNRGFSLIF